MAAASATGRLLFWWDFGKKIGVAEVGVLHTRATKWPRGGSGSEGSEAVVGMMKGWLVVGSGWEDSVLFLVRGGDGADDGCLKEEKRFWIE